MKGLSLVVAGAGLVAAIPAGQTRSEDVPSLQLENIVKMDVTSESNGLGAREIFGPALGVDFPDPAIIWGDGSWKAYATSSNNKRIPIATSSDAKSWTLTSTDALPNLPSWIDKSDTGLWAPDVNKNDAGTYVMYFSGKKTGGRRCIGVATSKSSSGPFTASETPLICDDANGGVIDASGYDDGKDRWIVWKVDGNALGGATTCQGGTPSGAYKPTPIKIQKMNRDALTLVGSAKTILDNEGASNNGVVEAPTVHKISDGRFILFYSAHCYSSDDYDIEYAFSNTIDGTYSNRGILIRTVDNRGIYAPGGIDVDPNGKNVVFHGRTAPSGQGDSKRQMYSATLTLSSSSASI
ncbi:unnamed protein product [Clonostachys rosea]|uniref:Endo-1,5-alpha-L-arabinanase A n=1 Tax=Bionectria ochroleuca TaxID=29856 RepID=A0ABY6UZ77_BIOOC|nr:unnamed protein product [Clonostachys rosea]